MSRSRRSKAAKASRRGWSTHPPSLVVGKVYGEVRVIVPDTGRRQCGKRLALVEDVKTGERKDVIASNVVSSRIISLGRIRKERYREHVERQKAMAETDLENIDPEVIRAALRPTHRDVDAESGKCISEVRKMTPAEVKQQWQFEHGPSLHAIADQWLKAHPGEPLPKAFDYEAYFHEHIKDTPLGQPIEREAQRNKARWRTT